MLLYLQINIWEERKVFGSRGQILKEEFGGRHLENSDRNGKDLGHKVVAQILSAHVISNTPFFSLSYS